FGSGFDGAFVFMFWCEAEPPDALFHEMFEFNRRWYAVLAIRLAQYRGQQRPRSAKWGTVSVPARFFQASATPLAQTPYLIYSPPHKRPALMRVRIIVNKLAARPRAKTSGIPAFSHHPPCPWTHGSFHSASPA